MLSQATSVDGQGVGSAYLEQVALIKECDDIFEVGINSKSGKFDIYHMHTVNPQYRMRFNKRHVNVAYVHFIPSTLDGSIKMNKLFFSVFKKYVISTYRKADEIVVVNPSFIPPLMELGIKKENITYIPNFVDHEKFHKLNDEERMAIGGFSFGKMTDGYKELKAIMDNPPENVKFIGIVPRVEMNGIFNMCDMLFMPSLSELFPMAILEAVNSFKPVLLRDLELYEEILFKDQECYAIGRNVDEFDAEVKKLASDPKYYEKYSKGSKVISDFYSKEHVKNIWREYYPRILEKWAPKKKIKPAK